METIFDHSPLPEEVVTLDFNITRIIEKYGFNAMNRGLSKEEYLQLCTKEEALFDLALLMETRRLQDEEDKYWALIPELWSLYAGGYDCVEIPEQ